jgi:hypothetical protein
MLTEIRTRDQEEDQRGAWALAWNDTSMISFDLHSENTGTGGCQDNSTRNMPYIPRSVPNDAQLPNNPPDAVLQDQLKSCPDPESARLELMPCAVENTNGNTYLSAAPRSLHTGGVNAARIDASVDWLADDIDVYLMARMVSINDGQTLREGAGR